MITPLGGFGIFWFMNWMIFIKKDPSSDPRISEEERTYIEYNKNIQIDPDLHRTPWKSLLTSSAVYAFIICSCCDIFATNVFLILTPKYLKDVLQNDLGTTGFLVAAPYLVYIPLAALTGIVSDYLRSKEILSTQQVRKAGVTIGFLVSGVFLFIMSNSSNLPAISTCLVIAIGITAISKTSLL